MIGTNILCSKNGDGPGFEREMELVMTRSVYEDISQGRKEMPDPVGLVEGISESKVNLLIENIGDREAD